MSGGGPLRAAVIGCGAIAYEHLPYLVSAPDALPVALCDRSPAMARAAASHFGLDCPVFADADEMLQSEKPDIVHILTPPETHAALVRMSLAAGAHVICEKPMTGSAAETAGLFEAAKDAGHFLVESRNLLFNDPVIALREAIESGTIGSVRECDVLLALDFLSGPFGDTSLEGPATRLRAGAVHDFLPHLVYLYQALTGTTTADAVTGVLANVSGNRRAAFDLCDVLVASDGVRGRLRIAADVAPSSFRIAVRGTRGSLETDLYNPYWRYDGPPFTGKTYALGQMRAGLGLFKSGAINLRNKIRDHGTMHGMSRMLEATYGALRAGVPPPITPGEIIATAALTEQIAAMAEVA